MRRRVRQPASGFASGTAAENFKSGSPGPGRCLKNSRLPIAVRPPQPKVFRAAKTSRILGQCRSDRVRAGTESRRGQACPSPATDLLEHTENAVKTMRHACA
jgi:hypothetical protein